VTELNGDLLSKLLPHILEDFQKKGRSAAYFDDVRLWAQDKLGLDIWWKQEEIARAIATGSKKSVAVRAGHGVGKSFLAGLLACWWIDTRPIQYVFVASTAPSADQVGAILWREIRRFWSLSHERHNEYKKRLELGKDTTGWPDSPLPGYITQDNKWKDDLGNLIGQGRKPPDHSEDAFQGIHAEYVLAIGDEACGLNENMIDSLANITSNAKSRRLLIANPTNPNSRLGEIFSDKYDDNGVRVGDAWSLHHISVLDSPNFHGGDKCKCDEHRGKPHGLGLSAQALAALTDDSYVIEKKAEYGENSARYKARVLGEFAYDAGNNLFDQYIIGLAVDTDVYVGDDARVVLGVDVARSAHGDSTFIYSFTTGYAREFDDETGKHGAVTSRKAGQLRKVDSFRGVPLTSRFEKDGTWTVGQATLIHQYAIELGATEVRVDRGGLGVGLIDGLWGLCRGEYEIIDMVGGGPTPDIHAFTNNRAFQFDLMRKRFESKEIDVDPADKLLIQQLEDILYEFKDPYGALAIESKDSMKKRGVKSPDAADAAWYACADLSHLTGPKAGDVVRKDPADVMKELMMSGFKDTFTF
jgi:hypothetical protein